MKSETKYKIIDGPHVVIEVQRMLRVPQTLEGVQGMGVIGPSGRFLGGVIFHSWNPEHDYIEIGAAGTGLWLIAPLRLRMLEYARTVASKAVFRVSEYNRPALRLLSALGCTSTRIPALRGPNEAEIFCILDLQKIHERVRTGHGWKFKGPDAARSD